MAITMSIGNVTLSAFEVPSEFSPGGKQMHAVHDAPGGQRDVQTYGDFPGPLNWSGQLLGATAFDRSNQLEALRSSGQSVRLTLGGYSADVVVTEYVPHIHHEFEIVYEIALVVVTVLSAPISQPAASMDDTALSGMQQANSSFQNPVSSQFPGSALLAAFQQFAVNMDACFPFSNLTADIARLLIDEARSVESQITSFQGKFATAAQSVDDMNAFLDAESALTGVKMARMTLENYYSANAVNTAYYAGLTVFDIASQVYGDATQGLAILQANGLTDPKIATPTALTIPPGLMDATTPSGLFQTAIGGATA